MELLFLTKLFVRIIIKKGNLKFIIPMDFVVKYLLNMFPTLNIVEYYFLNILYIFVLHYVACFCNSKFFIK